MFEIGLDLGGSVVRYGCEENAITECDSQLTVVDEKLRVRGEVKDSLGLFKIVQSKRKSICGKTYAHGEIRNYLTGKDIECNNDELKVEQDITYVNAIYSVAKQLLKTNGLASSTDVAAAACIPTAEFYSANKDYASIIKNDLIGLHSVHFVLLNKTVTFNLKVLRVCPEGVIAVLPLVKKNAQYKNSRIIIPDVGYRSTDITILENLKPIARGAVSRPLAGINLEAALMSSLERENIPYNSQDIRDIIKRGTVKEGSKTIDVAALVKQSKDYFASALYEEIRACVAASMYNIRSMEAIAPVGRIFTAPTNPACGNMASILQEAFPFEINMISIEDPGLANIKQIIRSLHK